MESEPDYGQYWQPDSQSAEGYGQQQPPGYEQQQPAPQPQQEQQQYGYTDYSGYDGRAAGYADYPAQPGDPYAQQYPAPYPPEPYAQEYPQQQYAQEYAQDYAQQYAEQFAAQYPAAPDTTGTPDPASGGIAAEAGPAADLAADPTDPELGAAAAAPSGAVASGAGRASRRGGRGRGTAPGEAAAADGSGRLAGAGSDSGAEGFNLARLLAVATGRAPGTDRKVFLTRAVLGATALVVLCVAGYAVAGGGSGPKHSPAPGVPAQADLSTGHTKSWAAPADTGATNGNDGLVGSWLLSSAVVRGDGMGVTAYNATSGSPLWTVAPPSAGAVPCAMSQSVGSTGIGAVLYQAGAGAKQACNEIVAVDTTTGKQAWTAQLTTASQLTTSSVAVEGTQVVAVGSTGAIGFNAGTGKQSWTYGGPGKYCALTGNATGSVLLLQSTCADSNPKQQLLSVSADTGKVAWWRGLPENAASYTVLSANPAVVSVHMATSAQDTVLSFSATGDSQATIPVAQTGGQLDDVDGSFAPVPALFFQGNTMIAELSPTTTGGATTPSTSTGAPGAATAVTGSGLVSAFDLVSGKPLWQNAPIEKGQTSLVGLDGASAVVATEERIGQPARLSHFDLGTGKETAGGSFPQATGSLLTSGRVLYQGNQVFTLPQFTSTYSTAVTAYSSASSG
ncbi:outer membrane protein assembly factor BamB family protein [Streptacidiphilus albus]|uniref:outer membrane protein assembly factor BamB family protein n=1 Tax=Streptacidiphilus albus TaxID=105425 RepID=UPI00054C1750|nr:PQQ-binding-like beta-propeller repeat protein [Streptacidiphilus albus]